MKDLNILFFFASTLKSRKNLASDLARGNTIGLLSRMDLGIVWSISSSSEEALIFFNMMETSSSEGPLCRVSNVTVGLSLIFILRESEKAWNKIVPETNPQSYELLTE